MRIFLSVLFAINLRSNSGFPQPDSPKLQPRAAEFISHYEEVKLNTWTPSVQVRDVDHHDIIPGYFDVHLFGLHLNVSFARVIPGQGVLSTDAVMRVLQMSDAGQASWHQLPVGPLLRRMIRGHVVNRHHDTYVAGEMSTEGRFDGFIRYADQTYFLEPAERHPTSGLVSGQQRTVAYRASDVITCNQVDNGSGCPDAEATVVIEPRTAFRRGEPEVAGVKRAEPEVAGVEKAKPEVPDECSGLCTTNNHPSPVSKKFTSHRGTNWKRNEPTESDTARLQPSGRNRRQTGRSRVCSVRAVADHTFTLDLHGGDLSRAAREMYLHLEEANRIFAETDLAGAGKLRLSVSEIVVVDSRQLRYPLSQEYRNPELLLQQMSQLKFDDVCLGFVFVYRQLANSVLGASFNGDPRPEEDGGACCPGRKRYAGNGDALRNLNVGFASFKYDGGAGGRLVPRARSLVTVAHEIGHLFGAPHDQLRGECSPDQAEEKFLMTVYRPVIGRITAANRRFSVCSRRSIARYLAAKGQCTIV